MYSKMKLCGFLQVYNEMEKGNLPRCISNLKKFCDVIAVYDDGSTDGSVNYLMSEGGIVYIRGDRNDFLNETRHKQQLLDYVLGIHPDIDWFFKIDCDEVLSKGGVEGIRGICEGAEKDIDGIALNQVNLWRSYGWYRTDYYQWSFVRLWRNKPGIKFQVAPGLHNRQYPLGIDNVWYINDPDII